MRYRKDFSQVEFGSRGLAAYGPGGAQTREEWQALCIEQALKGPLSFAAWQHEVRAQEADAVGGAKNFWEGKYRVEFPFATRNADGIFGTSKLHRCAADFGNLECEHAFAGYQFFFGADFSGAKLLVCDFSKASFTGELRFFCTDFFDHSNFSSIEMFGTAQFYAVHFRKSVALVDCKFDGILLCSMSTSSGPFALDGTQFRGEAIFTHNKFTNAFRCQDAVFSRCSFASTTFAGPASFQAARFSEGAAFEQVKFLGDVDFTGSQFHQEAVFSDSSFSALARFGDKSYFNQVPAPQGRKYNPSLFLGTAYFERVTFSGPALFDSVSFRGNCLFTDATFDSIVRFSDADFGNDANFDGAFFTGAVDLRASCFRRCPSFLGVEPSAAFIVAADSIGPDTSPLAIDRFRALKLIASTQNNTDAALAFNAHELRARAREMGEPLWFRLSCTVYDKCSKFGTSAKRPFVLLLSAYILFMLLALAVSPFLKDGVRFAWSLDLFDKMSCSWQSPTQVGDREEPVVLDAYRASFEYTWTRSFGVFDFVDEDKWSRQLNQRLWGKSYEPWPLRLAGIFFGFHQLLMAFFLVLAVRNRFRL